MDATAFADFYAAEQSQLMGYCIKQVRERDDAEDVAAETWARAWRHREKITSRGWLYRVAANVATDMHRARAWFAESEPERGDEGIEDFVVTAQVARDLVAKLPERDQLIVSLRLHGWTHGEIAQAIGATDAEARQAASRAMKRLRETA